MAALIAIGACSDDDADSPGGVSGSATTSGSSGGGAGGSGNTAGSSSGGSAGDAQAGATGSGEGGAGGAGVGVGGAGGDLGVAGASEAGSPGASGAGGEGGAEPAPACDYVETEASALEETGISAGNAVRVICANVNNGSFSEVDELVDTDSFDVELPGESEVLVRVEVPGAAALTEAYLFVNSRFTPLVNGRAVIRRETDDPETYTISLDAFNEADIATSLPYRISVVVDDVDARCAASTGTATWTEAADGASHRSNDVYVVDEDSVAAFTAANDTAEASGINVAAAPVKYRMNGSAADVAPSGDYYDSDSYAFRTGPNAQQITLRADWGGTDRDFDLFLFKAGEEQQVAIGFNVSLSGEYVTAVVEPNADYVIWAGLWDGTMPAPYSLTLCSEAFSLGD